MRDLIQTARLGWRLLQDPRVPAWIKIGVPLLVILYFVFPIDILPDFIPGLGQLDDIGVVLLGINLIARLSPDAIVEEHKRNLGINTISGPTYHGTDTDYWKTPPGQGEPTRRVSKTNGSSIEGDYRVIPPDR